MQGSPEVGRGARYGLANAWTGARTRLATLEAWLDPATRRHLQDRGLRPGWSCLEVGAGGGSVASWPAEAVGPSGEVLATDIDPCHVEPFATDTLRVLRHDVAREPLPRARFDLVHCRLVLAHLPQRDQALESMIGAVKPGGWAHLVVLRDRGFDAHYGRRLPDDLRRHGLEQVGSDGHSQVCVAGTPGSDAMRLTLDQLRDDILASGLDADTVDQARALCSDPEFSFLSQTTVSAWGRRPSP